VKEGNVVVKTVDGKVLFNCSIYFLLLNFVDHSFNNSFTVKISDCEVFIDGEQIESLPEYDENENETL
jgi:hypothetical protein